MGQGAAGAAGATGGAGGAVGAGATGGGLSGFLGSAMPFVSLGLGVANIGMSIAQASKQQDLQREAERAAEKAAAEQERLVNQNFYEALQVPMQAYDREFRETTAQQQQAMSALQEGDPRLLIGGVGKVQAIAGEQEAKTREDLGKDLFEIGKLQAEEAGQTNDKLAMIQGQRLAGAQQAAADAAAAKMQNQQSALSAGGDLLKGLGGMVSEYSNNRASTNANNMDMSTALAPAEIAPAGLNASSQLQSNTANALADMQKKYGWMTMDFSKFGAAR